MTEYDEKLATIVLEAIEQLRSLGDLDEIEGKLVVDAYESDNGYDAPYYRSWTEHEITSGSGMIVAYSDDPIEMTGKHCNEEYQHSTLDASCVIRWSMRSPSVWEDPMWRTELSWEML